MKKYIRKQEIVSCIECGVQFSKDSSEVKRNIKLSRNNFCSLKCVSKYNNKHNIKNRYNGVAHLNPSNRVDEFTGFREHLRRIKYRTKEVDLTLQDMLDVWNKQQGICIYSKVQLQKCSNINFNDRVYSMSLDRIDSSKGYVKDNIQFISIAMNYLKNSMTHQEMLEIIELIKNSK